MSRGNERVPSDAIRIGDYGASARGNAMAAVTELGYVCFGVSNLAEWRDFAANLLGLEVVEEPGERDRLYLRTDYWHHRIIL
jgi:catechol-2,3-dioxygenase